MECTPGLMGVPSDHSPVSPLPMTAVQMRRNAVPWNTLKQDKMLKLMAFMATNRV
jgi:hypothetical protein